MVGGRRREPQGAEKKLIRVEVRTLQGEELELQRDSRSTVIQLKRALAELWQHAPAICQRLMVGTTLLEDIAPLAAYAPQQRDCDASVLRLMLVVSLEDAKCHLANEDWNIRREALLGFARVAPQGNKGAVSAVSALLVDDMPEVRLASLKALASIAPPCDEQTRDRALGAVMDRFKDPVPLVRREALRTLAEVAPGSSGSDCQSSAAVLASVGLLSDKHKSVSQEALRTLRLVVPQGGPLLIDAIVDHLRNVRPDVRIIAVHALAWAAGSSKSELTERVLASIGRLLVDIDSHVRQAAVWAFTHLLPDDQERAVALSVAQLQYGRADARLGALRSLARDCPYTKDSLSISRAIGAVSECLKDQTKGLRLEALKVLAHLAPQGDSRCVTAVSECLHDKRPEVRLAAMRLLPFLAGDKDAVTQACSIDAAVPLHADECIGVQHQAADAPRTLARSGIDPQRLARKWSAVAGDSCGRSLSCVDLRSHPVPLRGPSDSLPAIFRGQRASGAVRNPLFAAAGMLLAAGS
jgi:hypothetical protein